MATRLRRVKWATAGLALITAATALYYVHTVRVARRETPALIEAARARYPGPLTARDLTPARKAMLLAVEDPTFERHHGVDLETPGAGMTTLTEGLVKLIYYPEGYHPGIAKIRQALIAQYALDAQVSKDDQLGLFLNLCYLGNEQGREVHGFSDAARTYFGKKFGDLSDDEFLSLVAMFIGPDSLKPGTPAGRARVERIRKLLAGELRPASVMDFDYMGKRRGTFSEEALMALLRVITDARPL
jgi:membrane carboxypeptidase/penicillin-binding protein